MITTQLNKDQMTAFYNVLCQGLFKNHEVNAPFDGIIGVLKKGEISTPHRHHETEIFFLLEGEGIIVDDTSNKQMKIGDIYISKPFESHSLHNLGEEDLTFISIWWPEKDNISTHIENYVESLGTNESQVLITATPPTPNGDLHLGHLSGPFLNSDIIKRIYDLKNVANFSVCGLDDNQNYVVLKGIQENSTPNDIAEKNGRQIKKTWKLGNIDYDFIVEPKEEEYQNFVDDFFKKLYEKGVLVKKESEVYYDENDNHIFEAFIRGECPHCGADSDGLACEQCGMPNDCVNLINPINKISKELRKKKVSRLVLQTASFKDALEKYLSGINLTYRLSTLKDLFLSELPEIAITHPAKWGIKPTINGYENQVYYVWAEMAAAFLYASKKKKGFELDNQQYWKDQENLFIQCFGFDNAYFYMFLFPILWMSYDKDIKLPDHFITNEFLCLDGKKFSTSRKHAIWAGDILEQIDADFLRFYLSLVGPSKRQTNFSLNEFKAFNKKFWELEFVSWTKDLQSRLEKYFGNKIPDTGAWSKDQVIFLNEFQRVSNKLIEIYNSISLYNPNTIANLLTQIVSIVCEFSKNEKELYTNENFLDYLRTSIVLEINTYYYLSFLIYPLMPKISTHMRGEVKLKGAKNSTFNLGEKIELKEFESVSFNIEPINKSLNTIYNYNENN